MQKVSSFYRGYVIIRVEGGELLRFLNLLKAGRIAVWNMDLTSDGVLTASLSAKDFLKLRQARRKTGVHIQILKKCGMPFQLQKAKRQKHAFLGIFFGIFLLIFLSSRVWQISVEGNSRNSTSEMIVYLSSQGIFPGMWRKKVDCKQIAADIREAYPDVTWVTAKLSGTKLTIRMKEGILLRQEEPSDAAADLCAGLSGKIVRMVVRNGTPVKNEGDSCVPGELLISGKVEIKNDAQEVVRTEYAAADGDIYVEHEIPYYDEFSLMHEEEHYESSTGGVWFFSFGDWYLELPVLCIGGKKEENGEVRIVSECFGTKKPGMFSLPFSIGKKTWNYYRKTEEIYSKSEAQSLAMQRLEYFEKKLIEKGVQISANNVTIKVSDFSCTGKGTITVIEKDGVSHTAVMKEPEERNAEDGE